MRKGLLFSSNGGDSTIVKLSLGGRLSVLDITAPADLAEISDQISFLTGQMLHIVSLRLSAVDEGKKII